MVYVHTFPKKAFYPMGSYLLPTVSEFIQKKIRLNVIQMRCIDTIMATDKGTLTWEITDTGVRALGK